MPSLVVVVFFVFFLIVIISDPLDSSKGLPTVSLLNSYMDIILSASRMQIITLTCINKGVERVEVLDSSHMIRFLFLSGNGQQKAEAGEGGQVGGRAWGSQGARLREAAESLVVAQWANLFVLTLSLSYTLLCPPKILPVK